MPQDPFDDIVRGYDQQFAPPKVKPVKSAKPPSFDDLVKDVDGQAGSVPTRREQRRQNITALQDELTATTPQVKPGNTLNVVTGRQYPTPPPKPFQSPIDLRLNAPNEAQKAFDRAAAAVQPVPQPKPELRTKQTLGQMRQQARSFQPVTQEDILRNPVTPEERKASVESFIAKNEREKKLQQAAAKAKLEEEASRASQSTLGRMGTRFARGAVRGVTQTPFEFVQMANPDSVVQQTMKRIADDSKEWQSQNLPVDNRNPATLNVFKPEFYSLENVGKAATENIPEVLGEMLPQIALARGAGGVARAAAPELAAATVPRMASMTGAQLATRTAAGGYGAAQQSTQAYQKALDAGMTPEQAARAAAIEAPIGFSEFLGSPGTTGFTRPGTTIRREMREEGLQELGQTAASGLAGKYASGYDANKPLLDIAGESIGGGLLGAATGGIVAAPGARLQARQQANQQRATRSAIDQRSAANAAAIAPQPVAAQPVTEPLTEPIAAQPQPSAPKTAPIQAQPTQPEGLPRLPARELSAQDKLAQAYGAKEPVENRINAMIGKAETLLGSQNEKDRKDGERMMNRVLTAIRQTEGYLAEVALPPDAPRPFTAVRDAIEARLKPAPKAPKGLNPEVQKSVDLAKQDAVEAEQAGNYEAAANHWKAAHSSLVAAQREIRRSGNAEQIKAIATDISIADANRRKAMQAARTAQRQANAPTADIPKQVAKNAKNEAGFGITPQATDSAPLLRPDAVQNPEGGIPAMPEPSFTDRLEAAARRDASARGKAKPAKRLLSRIAELGGISDRYAGELQDVKDARRVGVIRDRATMSPDVLARQLQSEGYDVDPEDLNTLWEAARRDIAGRDERTSQTSELERRLAEEEAAYNERQPFDQIVADVDAEPTNRLRDAEYEGGEVQRYSKPLEGQVVEREAFQPDTADLREVREFSKREPRTEQFTEEPPTAPLARRRQPIRPPAPISPRQVGNRPLSVDVAGTRTPTAMSPDFPRARREMVRQGREVEARLELGQEKGGFGNVAEAMFKSNTPDVLHGQDSFFHDPDLKGKLGLTRDAEMADVRRELKTQLARSLGLTAEEVSLSHIKPEVWRAWAKQKGLGREAVRKLEAGIARAERKQRATETNAAIVAEESQRAKEELRQPEKMPNEQTEKLSVKQELFDDAVQAFRGEGDFKASSRYLFALAERLEHHFTDGIAHSDGTYVTSEGDVITPGEYIGLHFIGSPSDLTPFTAAPNPVYKLVKAELTEFHGAGSKSGVKLYVEDANGKRAEFTEAGRYSPERPTVQVKPAAKPAPSAKSIDQQIKDIQDEIGWNLSEAEAKRKIAALEARRPKEASQAVNSTSRPEKNYWKTPLVTSAPTTPEEGQKLVADSRAEFRPSSRRGGTLWTNQQGAIVIASGAIQTGAKIETGGFAGLSMSLETATITADFLRGRAEVYGSDGARLTAIADSLDSAVDDAIANKQKDVTIADSTAFDSLSETKQVLYEEKFHSWQRRAGVFDPAVGRALDATLRRNPAYNQIRTVLLEEGYSDDPVTLSVEAAAKVASGQSERYLLQNDPAFQRLKARIEKKEASLSDIEQVKRIREQAERKALDFLNDYFKASARMLGVDALAEMATATPQARKVQENVRREIRPDGGIQSSARPAARTGQSSAVAASLDRRATSERDRRGRKANDRQIQRVKRFSFGRVPEGRGQVLASFPANIQSWLGKNKPKEANTPTKPEPIPTDWNQQKWTKKAMDALVTRDMPKEDREKFFDFSTKKPERLALLQKYMPSEQDIDALAGVIDRANNALKNNDGDDLREAVWAARAIVERPATNPEKGSALMRAAMFSRPIGRMRDLISNFAEQKLATVARIPGSAADAAFTTLRRMLTGEGERTFLGPRPAEYLKNRAVDRAKQWKQTKDVWKGKHVDALEDVLQHREVNFDNKFLDKTTKAVFRAMGAADQWFFVKEYQRAIREQAELAARADVRSGVITKADRQKQTDYYAAAPTTEMKAMAELAAKQMVFRNPNFLSDKVFKPLRENLPPGANFALDIVMPVDRTPTNIILTALEYSPLGAVKLAGQMATGTVKATAKTLRNRKDLPTRQAIKKALDEAFPPEKQRAMSRLFGRTVTGTSAPVALGFALASAGMATGFYDEDDPGEEAERREEGKMPNSVKIGGRWYELSGIAPLGMLIGLGATLHREMHAETLDPEKRYARLAKGFGNMAMELPALESAKQTVKMAKAATGKPSDLGRIAGNIGARFVPGLVSDLGQATPYLRDPYEREIKAPKSGEKDTASLATKAGREFAGEFGARIPGVRRLLPPKMNTLTGKPVETEWSDVIDPFRSRKAVEPGSLSGVKAAQMKFDISSEVRPKIGEPDEIFQQRKQRVESWMSEYGDKLLSHPSYTLLTESQKQAAMESLRRRISNQQNKREPKRDLFGNIESFAPEKVIQSVLKSEVSRPKREASKLWSPPANRP